MITVPKPFATTRTLPTAIANEVQNAILAEDVSAEFDDRVA